ncbi:MAG TPA: DNA methyltransferase [Niabella sp.]|nr:site-specific DNA-methyltransferase [Chitinophagaceae bacterium]MCZ2131197.1 site-specific DNA-methyltransferase [Bacteroidia bacterium]HRO83885.1 DNA methyltransferase [Niabella sp.]HUN03114.1 DNA methyltransferase [Niabella sp.]
MQGTLFDIDVEIKTKEPDISEWGTFRDSLRAPVHGWFTYPAGFSYKAVEHSIEQADLTVGTSTIYDPFMGSGTTNLVAKSLGFNSIGVEAHPFVHRITQSKMNWDISFDELNNAIEKIQKQVSKAERPEKLEPFLKQEFPELILKCFLPETLFELWTIRNSILKLDSTKGTKEFLRTALICVLRDVSIAATGWPYIAPNKTKVTSMSKKGWETYRNRVLKMYGDIVEINRKAYKGKSTHQVLNGDSRNTVGQIADESADHIFTSPPYLNNFDYADRTRLELYFMGEAKNWGEISDQVRKKLMTSATTQINRTDSKYQFLEGFKFECPDQYTFLSNAVEKLSELRLTKGGKKSYDLMTIGYFNDIYQIIKDNFRVLRKGSKALYILGDSAPYGVHIPTDELIGQIGVAIGFSNYQIQILRERGGKWEKNPQRHNVMLRESVVILQK